MLKLLRYLRKREWLYVFCALVFIILKVYLSLKMPDYMSVVTKISQGAVNPKTGEPYQMSDIWVNGGLMTLCALGSSISSIIVMIFATRIAADLSARLREMVYRKVQGFSLDDINRFSTASLITRTTNDIQQVQFLVVTGFDMVFRIPITIIWVIIKMAGMQWKWSIGVGIAIIVMVIGIIVVTILVRKKVKKLQTLTDSLNQVTRENIGGIRVVRAYNAEKYQENKFEKVNKEFTDTNLFTSRSLAFMSPFISMVMNSINLIIYWIGAYVINSSPIEEFVPLYTDMVVFISYGVVIASAFANFTIAFMVTPRALASARRINEVLEVESSTNEGEGVGETEEKGTIEFRNVSFRYPDGGENVISNISFKANRGQTVAFIGSTGCGKSSLIRLIPRFYDATEGEVLVDGHNVKEYKKKELSKKIGYVSQKAVIFSGTVRDNVNFGDNDADEERIKEALEVSQATSFVEGKEGGIDARVAQNGTNFSGGQKQRLSIARAIARNPEIYILDDPSSALDYKTDQALRKSFRKMKDATRLIVAQRISVIMKADQIIVLEDGKIVGKGTHEELLESCATYQEIARSQLSEEELL